MMTRRLALASLALTLAACSDDPPATPADTADASDTADTSPDTTDTDGDTTNPTPPDLALRPAPGTVVAGVTVKPADLIGGPKAEGQVGDLVLENNVATFLIEGVRPAGGYRQYGGILADADLQPGGEDRLGELWFVWNMQAFRPDSATVVSDGRDGLAVVRVTGRTEPYVWIQTALSGLLLAEPIDIPVVYEYRLAPDSNVLELVVTLENDGAELVDVSLPILASNQGDGAFAFAPSSGLTDVDGVLPWIGAVGLSRSYGFIANPAEQPVALVQVNSVQISLLPQMLIAPGASRQLRFHYVVSDTGTTAIEETRANLHDVTTTTIAGTVTGDIGFLDEQVPSHTYGKSWVAVTRGADILAVTPIAADGSYRALIPAGDPVTVQAFAPARGASAPVEVATSRDDVDLELPALGELVVRVRDQNNDIIPAQVDVFRVDAPDPFAPQAVRFNPDWGRGRSAVLFHTEDQARVHLLPGAYRVVASRGYSYELDEANIDILPGTTRTLDLVLTRAVDTSGWVAADMHLHAFWSPDSDVPYPTRLRQAAANDVALPVFTEHTYMGDIEHYRPEADVDAWVRPIPGQEVSTIEYGHFNAYPLKFDATKPSGGAVFEHGRAGTELFDAIRAQHDGDLLLQINHPRISSFTQAYFNAIELDSAALVANKPERWMLDWDVLEVFNERCQGDAGNATTLQDWFNLNDHGIMKALGSGSDSHSEGAGLGHPRSWIPIPKSAVDADLSAIVDPLRARRSFVSCGPFVRFTGPTGEPTGSVITTTDGKVSFRARVEAPTWIAIDRVRLLQNGVPVVDVDLATWTRPNELPLTVRFEGNLEATPTHDAWYVLEVVGSGTLWPLQPGEAPYAMTNAIQVDADADGQWTPPVQTGTTRPKSNRALPADAKHHDHSHHDVPEALPLPAQRYMRARAHAHPHDHAHPHR